MKKEIQDELEARLSQGFIQLCDTDDLITEKIKENEPAWVLKMVCYIRYSILKLMRGEEEAEIYCPSLAAQVLTFLLEHE